MKNADTKLQRLLGDRRFGPGGAAPLVPSKPMPVFPPLRSGDVHIGDADTGGQIGLDLAKLVEGRLLIQGVSGVGKSWTLRRLLELTAGLIQQIIVDPEGEYRALAERFGHTYIAAHQLDTAALATIAKRAREHRLSLVLDLSELDREGQMKAVGSVFPELIDAPREHWHPLLVAIDEAHLFAPFGGYSEVTSVRKAAIAAVVDIMSRGRKRGITGVLATQRLARLAKSVASEVHNFMIGMNTLDLDIRRAAETIGWDARKGFDRLPSLQPGDFVAVGPGFSRGPVVLRVGPVETRHVGAAPVLGKPAPVDKTRAAKLLDLDALIEASAAEAETRENPNTSPGFKAVRAFIREPSFVNASAAWGALVPLWPDGTTVDDLAKHLKLTKPDTAAALALLDHYGAVEFSDEKGKRAVRLSRDMKDHLP